MAVVDTLVADIAVGPDAAADGRGVEDGALRIHPHGIAAACVLGHLVGLRRCDRRLLPWSTGGRVPCILARLGV